MVSHVTIFCVLRVADPTFSPLSYLSGVLWPFCMQPPLHTAIMSLPQPPFRMTHIISPPTSQVAYYAIIATLSTELMALGLQV